jgi:DNA-binding NarL/FixJ family response regulator
MLSAKTDDRPVRIILADDHALFRAGMAHLLRDLPRPVEVREVDSRDDVVAALEAGDVDLVLIDLMMPGMEREDGLAEIKKLAGDVPVTVVSMLDSPTDIRESIASGASGFIPKSSTPTVMLRAIELILSGGVYLPPAALGTAPASPSSDRLRDRSASRTPPTAPSAQPVAADGKPLTRRQQAVLRELATGKSNKEIAYALDLAEATVKVHIAAIMRALNAQNRTQVVLAAVERGLMPGIGQPAEH